MAYEVTEPMVRAATREFIRVRTENMFKNISDLSNMDNLIAPAIRAGLEKALALYEESESQKSQPIVFDQDEDVPMPPEPRRQKGICR